MFELTDLLRDVALAGLILVAGGTGSWLITRLVRWRAAGPIGLFIAAPLIPNLDLAGPLSTDDLLPLLGLAIVMTQTPWPSLTRDRLVRIGLGALAFVIAARLATALVHVDGFVELAGALAVALLRPAFLLAVAVAVAASTPAAERRRFVAIGLAALGTFEGAFTSVAYLIPTPGIGIRPLRQFENLAGCDYRVTGTLGLSPNHIGAVFVVTIPFTIGLATAARGRWRWLWIATASLQGVAVFMTFTRASIALAAAAAHVVLLYHRQFRLVFVGAFLTALMVLIMTTVACAPSPATPGSPIPAQGPSPTIPKNPSDAGSVIVDRLGDSTDRLALWYTAALMTLDHPVFGVGIGNMVPVMRSDPERYVETPYGKSTNSAHNTILLAGAETGIVGAAATLVLNIVIALFALRLLCARGEMRVLSFAAGIALLAFLAQGMVNNLFTVPATATLLALVIGAFVGSDRKSESDGRSSTPQLPG
jgi:hypothetical protein